MSEQRSMDQTSRHFQGVWLGLGDDKGREMMGVRLNDGREVIVNVSANGRNLSVTLNGKKMQVIK